MCSCVFVNGGYFGSIKFLHSVFVSLVLRRTECKEEGGRVKLGMLSKSGRIGLLACLMHWLTMLLDNCNCIDGKWVCHMFLHFLSSMIIDDCIITFHEGIASLAGNFHEGTPSCKPSRGQIYMIVHVLSCEVIRWIEVPIGFFLL